MDAEKTTVTIVCVNMAAAAKLGGVLSGMGVGDIDIGFNKLTVRATEPQLRAMAAVFSNKDWVVEVRHVDAPPDQD